MWAYLAITIYHARTQDVTSIASFQLRILEKNYTLNNMHIYIHNYQLVNFWNSRYVAQVATAFSVCRMESYWPSSDFFNSFKWPTNKWSFNIWSPCFLQRHCCYTGMAKCHIYCLCNDGMALNHYISQTIDKQSYLYTNLNGWLRV